MHHNSLIITFVKYLTKWLNFLVNSMKEINNSTEEKILAAAEQIFLQAGYSGSRMQDIADLAGINKALLHYYFRSKDKLFEHIFEKKIALMFPQMEELFNSNLSFYEVLCAFVEKYIGLIIENQFLPVFVISTINRPERQDFIEKMPVHFMQKMTTTYYRDFEMGKIKEINVMQLIISVFSMCAFPFMVKPILTKLTQCNDDQFKLMMQRRIPEIQSYLKLILEK